MTFAWIGLGALFLLATWSLAEDLRAKDIGPRLPELPPAIARYTTADGDTDWPAFEAYVAKTLAWEDQYQTFRDLPATGPMTSGAYDWRDRTAGQDTALTAERAMTRESLTVDIGRDHAEVVIWHRAPSVERRAAWRSGR